jgi:dihydroorotase
MTRLLLAGGRIIDPASGRDERADLLIDGDRIAAISPVGSVGPADALSAMALLGPPDRTIDCCGKIVAPGLIDLHVHLREAPVQTRNIQTRNSGQRTEEETASDNTSSASSVAGVPSSETIASGVAAAVAGGFTAVCAMPNTRPPIDSAEAVAWYADRARQAGLARVHVVGCMTRGRAGREVADLAAMRKAGAAMFSDDGSDVADPAVFEAVLTMAARLGAAVSCHCEDPVLAAGGVLNDGPLATALGLPGIPPEAEEMAVQRACDMAERTGCRVHIAHVSTEGSVEIVRRAKAAGLPVTAEATPQHLTLVEESLASRDPVFKVNPPLRSGHDVDAVLAGVRDGTIDCLATDHAPHSAEAKSRGLVAAPPGMIGLESALAVYIKALIEPGLLTWPELLARLTQNPARVLGGGAGTLRIDAPADITIIDPDARWTIDPTRFASRARNCPFAGWQVRGRAVMTIVGGMVVYGNAERGTRSAE